MIRVVAFLFAAFLIGIIVLANTGRGSFLFQWVSVLPGGDFTGHIVLMGTMSLLLNAALRFRTFALWGVPVLWGTAVFLGIATLEECSQWFIPSRSFSLGDMAGNAIGIVGFGEIGRWVYEKMGKSALDHPG